jgi:hypothetical protein
MAVISKAIPTLLRGVSQAADNTKQADHADIQDNADSNPVTGLTKRSGIQYVTNLSSSTLGNVHIQTINRDINERYVAIFSNGNVRVFELDGTEKTVHKPDGTTYLNTSDPRSVIKTVSVADFTFVVNTSITAAMDSTLSEASSNITQAVVFINQVSDKTTYSITVDGVTVTDDTSSDSTLSTTQVATDLVSGLNSGLTGFTIARNGPVIHIKKTDGSNFSIDGTDTQGNTHMTVVKDTIQRFTDLPTVSPNGYVVEVKGDENTDFDNYYVKFVTNNGNAFEEGQWEECVQPGINFKFDYSTMPHVLIRQADGFFRFARVDGDKYTALLKTATYSQSGTTVTITATDHGYGSLQNLNFHFLTGNAVDGIFPITKVDDDTFTFTAASSLTTSGNLVYETTGTINGIYAQLSGTHAQKKIAIYSTNHGFSVGDKVDLTLTADTAPDAVNRPADGVYTITDVFTNQFNVLYSELNTFVNTSSENHTGTFTYPTTSNQYTLPKWGERTVGDLDSAPNPSFIGSKINNVFFFRNRLGFLADDNVVLSRAAEFFNFFPETVLSVIDSEPIDVAASHTKVAILRSAVTVEQELILFSDQTQFVLTSSTDNLTPRTANVVVATEFESDDDAQPIGAGSSIYYLSKRGSFANVREYVYQRDLVIRESSNITVHVPRLIPSNLFKFAVSTSADVLVCLGTDEPNKLYINRWLYGSQYQKILNSWSTFTINENRSIKNVDFIGSDLFLVIEEANGTTLEKIPFENDFTEANATFEYRLDHKVTEATTGVSVAYNSTTNVSTFTVPYRLRANMNVVGRYLGSDETSTFVNQQGTTLTLKPGQIISTTNTTNGSTSTITATGDYRNSKFIIGEPYEMHYRFSQQRLIEGQGGGNSGEIISGRLQLHHFYIKFEDTGFFKVEVTPENRDTSTHKFTGRFLGAASSTIGSINLESGSFKVPVMSRADRVNIDIKNDTFLPTTLASAEYEAMFHMRSRRI